MYVCIVHDSSLDAVGELLQSCRAVLKYMANLAAVDENIEFQVEFRMTFAAVRECRRTLIMTPPLNTGSCLSLCPPLPLLLLAVHSSVVAVVALTDKQRSLFWPPFLPVLL